MAKARIKPSPYKGKGPGKIKASATPEPPVRRSPRKRIASAKKIEAEATASVKKASPMKKTSAAKKVASLLKKSPVSIKAKQTAVKVASPKSKTVTAAGKPVTPKNNVAPAPKKAPAPAMKRSPAKKSVLQSPMKEKTASPKPRGRPRKGTSPAATQTTETPKLRSRSPKGPSPGKVTKTKSSPKKAVARDRTHNAAMVDSRAPADHRLDYLRKLSDLVTGASSGETSGECSASTNKSLAKGGKKSAPGRASSPKAKKRTPKADTFSKNPTTNTSKTLNSSAAKSPARSRSPSKAGKVRASRQTGRSGGTDQSNSTAKGCNRSRTRESSGPLRSVAQSPSRVAKAASPRKTSASSTRTRSRSPTKAVDGAFPKIRAASNDKSSPAPSARPRTPAKQSNLLHSPSKISATSQTRNKVHGPIKNAARRNSTERQWDGKFSAADEYGKTLRKLEAKAYTAQKDGRVFSGVNLHVDEEDADRAKRQGIERAKAEFALRHLAGSEEQRVREGFERRLVELNGEDEDDEDYEEGPRRKRVADGSRLPASRSEPSNPSHNASKSSRQAPQSPPRAPSAARGPCDRESAASEDGEAFAPLPSGQPSAPGRGTVHSVTNPEVIAGTNKRNPFFETMPGPEQWHRNQPAYFMFGETPYIKQLISRQMTEDLRKSAGGGDREPEKPRSGSFAGLSNIFSAFRKSKDEPVSPEQLPQSQLRSPFALPDATMDEVEAMMQELGQFDNNKRKLSGSASPGRSPRKTQPISGDNGSRSQSPPAYRMSGAL